jgi:hypothetical protein
MQLQDLRWDPAVVLYRDPEGNRVPASILDEIVQTFKTQGSTRLRDIVTRLLDGEITLAEWEEFVGEALFELWVRGYTVGGGGPDYYGANDREALETGIRDQYEYLRGFALDIQSGILSEAMLRARMDLYINAVEFFVWAADEIAHEKAGFDEALRILEPGDSCEDCIRYAAMGWQPLGILPLPTQDCACRTNCRCRIVYRSLADRVRGIA